MIEFRNLTKRFGKLEVLRGLDLAVRAGCVTAVVGPNGAGKTTLIKSLLGLVRPDGGEIRLDGAPVDADGAYRARIGYMPQIARFPENLTASELVALVASLRGLAPDDPSLDRELVESLALGPHMEKPLRTLSGGTRQKVNAVIALLFRPDVLVLDEPTSGLDPVSSGVLKDRVLAERARGRTVIVTSHIMSELEELADDVAFVVEGVVRYAGPIRELAGATEQHTLERAVARLMAREAA